MFIRVVPNWKVRGDCEVAEDCDADVPNPKLGWACDDTPEPLKSKIGWTCVAVLPTELPKVKVAGACDIELLLVGPPNWKLKGCDVSVLLLELPKLKLV